MADQPAKTPLHPADFDTLTNCAVLVIDMWDQHWCKTMTARVQELAPKVNDFLVEARRRGALVIHAPSGARPMQSYREHPARQRAREAQGAPLPSFTPVPVSLPIVVSGSDPDHYGCEDTPKCAIKDVWTQEINTIKIDEVHDAIIGEGDGDPLSEFYKLLQQYQRKRLMVLGVHLNYCVTLTRPYSLNKLVALQKLGLPEQVMLVRDLTDCGYNPKATSPYINHFAGTDLMLRSVEETLCPTLPSSWLLGGQPFHFAADRRQAPPSPVYQPSLRRGIYKLRWWNFDPLHPHADETRWLQWDTTRVTAPVRLVSKPEEATPWRVEEFAPNLFTFALPALPDLLLGADPNTAQVQMQRAKEDSTAAKQWWYWDDPEQLGNAPLTSLTTRLIWCDQHGGTKYRYLVGDPKTDTVSLQSTAVSTPGWYLDAV